MVAAPPPLAPVRRYGNCAEKPPEDLKLLGSGTEKYVEYDRMGRVIRGQVRAATMRRVWVCARVPCVGGCVQ